MTTPPPDAEFLLEAIAEDGRACALVVSWVSEKVLAVALPEARDKRVFLSQEGPMRSIGQALLSFEAVARAFAASPPQPAPLPGLSPGEDGDGAAAQLFNLIWPHVMDAVDVETPPAQVLAALAAICARAIGALPAPMHPETFNAFCGNLQHMIKAEAARAALVARAN